MNYITQVLGMSNNEVLAMSDITFNCFRNAAQRDIFNDEYVTLSTKKLSSQALFMGMGIDYILL